MLPSIKSGLILISKSCQGFTLIELLVVIAVLGALSAGVVTTLNPNKRLSDSKIAVINNNFAFIHSEVNNARAVRGMVLGRITGNFCSACSCTGDVRNATCLNTMNTSWRRVTGKDIPFDPYGNPYLFDENEGEMYNGSNCRLDAVISVGPDHVRSTSDDRTYRIPTFFCP